MEGAVNFFVHVIIVTNVSLYIFLYGFSIMMAI